MYVRSQGQDICCSRPSARCRSRCARDEPSTWKFHQLKTNKWPAGCLRILSCLGV